MTSEITLLFHTYQFSDFCHLLIYQSLGIITLRKSCS
uniref:Uncharacterized protein n=1 Tax=Arundo donax TaxID=35708 RepID=A0A0A9G387_ARUDO